MKTNNIEIERKFLVAGDFYPYVKNKERILQAYLIVSEKKTVRIRLRDECAFLTVKVGKKLNSFSLFEYEYSVPVKDAKELLEFCLPGRIEKERHYVPFGNHIFEVDVFHGQNEGLVIAELELDSEDEIFECPQWLGKEVTGDPQYYNANLINRK